jgi:hypothetical protein
MGSKNDLNKDLSTLVSTVQTTLDLIKSLAESKSNNGPTTTNANALDLANDAASLIKAHATKLSLLIINKPFTPSAIVKVLRELVSGPLPGLASAIELCNATQYTKTMSTELQWRAKKVFKELGVLIEAIPLDGKILSNDAKNGTGTSKGKGSLASTGVVWEACDGIMQLKKEGIAGLLVKMAGDYRELIEDALWELQEWGEAGSDADEDGPSLDDDDVGEAQAALDNMFEAQKHIPSEDPEKIRPRFESSTKRLRLIMLMYQAVIKRRLKTLSQAPYSTSSEKTDGKSIPATIDLVVENLKKIPEITDELASAFYTLDGPEIDKWMKECFSTGITVADLLAKNWNDEDDEFTAWVSHIMRFNFTLSN